MEHRSVRGSTSTKMMTFHKTGKSSSLAGSHDVNKFVLSEDVDHDLVARIRSVLALKAYFAHKPRGRHVCLFEMAGHGLVHAFRFYKLHESKLHSVVPVFLLRLLLLDDTGAGLNDGYRNSRSVIFQKLRHPDLFSQQAGNHFACSRPNALISTSTPAGKSSFISASTVCGVGSRMSSSRLCVRISNCSRDFLSTCGERRTVNLLMTVGRGIGPATRAPVRFAVSTISVADWSSTLESYAFSRIRIFSLSMIS